MRVVSPIDPLEGHRYVETIYNKGKGDYLEYIYNVTGMKEYYIILTVDGNLIWKSASSCKSYLGEALENVKTSYMRSQ